jgi:enamine deaminase RidA (YjgF/YER057c/UK114 family)
MSPPVHPACERVHCAALPEPAGATWSNALRVGNELIISGVTAHPAASTTVPGQTLDTLAQALDCLRKIGLLAEAAGGSLDNVMKLVIYLTDIQDKDAVAIARRQKLSPPYPASTLVGVSALVRPELRIEIDATIRLDARRSTLATDP